MNTGLPVARPISQAPVLSVSALNLAVALLLERHVPLTWVAGEISNFTRAASGHWYFSLKDQTAQVRAVMFRGRAQYADFQPREGDKVEVRAQVTLYAPRGDYQLNVEAIRRSGSGDLYEAFLRLKTQLSAEGLFDAARKHTLPVFVRRIGIITSPQAAALRDVLSTLARRAPHVEIVLYPTPVQGEAAIPKIVEALRAASQRRECDVLLLCRGGGSIEDLWCFNAEAVARAIVACEIPLIAGIGHETDFTIADFAADVRAATPTAAAELAVTARADWLQTLHQQATALRRGMQRTLAQRNQQLDWISQRLQSPAQAIRVRRMQLHSMTRHLSYAARSPLQTQQALLQQLQLRWHAHRPNVRQARLSLQQAHQRLQRSLRQQQHSRVQTLQAMQTQLEMLNPQRTLERGYAILSDQHGNVIRASRQIQPKQALHVRLAEDVAEIGVASVQALLE